MSRRELGESMNSKRRLYPMVGVVAALAVLFSGGCSESDDSGGYDCRDVGCDKYDYYNGDANEEDVVGGLSGG